MRHRVIVLVALLAFPLPQLAHGQAQTEGRGSAFTPRAESPEEFPDHPGRESTFYECSACHNFRLVAAQGQTREQWDDTIDWMIARHNMRKPDAKERQALLDYLEKAFPPRAAGGGRARPNPFLQR